MKVIANITYNDKELNRAVAKGEVLEVSEERAKVLTENLFNGTFYCSFLDEEEVKPVNAPVRRKRK